MTDRFISIECLKEQLQESFSRQDAKIAKEDFSHFPLLGLLCVFARVVSFPIWIDMVV